MSPLLWKCGLCLLPFLTFSNAVGILCNFGLQTEATLGWREDSANWSIPGHTEEDPDIVSEVSWKDLRMIQIGANARLCGLGNLYARAFADYAWIYHGINRDSDFWSREKIQEFCRSINDAGKGETYDISACLGIPIIRTSGLTIVPVGGYAYMQQHLHMFDGKQVICLENPSLEGQKIENLDSKYHNRWKGPWTGLDVILCLGCLTVEGEWEYHWTHFFGKGDWNLRNDLASSFYDQANGHGTRYNLRLLYSLWNCLSFGLGADYWEFQAHDGKSEVAVPVHLVNSEGEILQTYEQWVQFGFREVNWRSFRINGVVSLSF